MLRRVRSVNVIYRIKRLFSFSRTKLVSLGLFFLGLLLLPMLFLNISVYYEYQNQIFEQDKFEEIPDNRIAIVFGAGVSRDGLQPSLILKDRLDTAIELYNLGKVQKIIVSGDNRFNNYNEPQVMNSYLIEKGVRDFDIQADYAGRSTYETCYRAKEIFGVSSATLISQEFHLPRALFTCEILGIEVYGASSDRNIYQTQKYNLVRERFALMRSFYNLYIVHPNVVLGDKVVI